MERPPDLKRMAIGMAAAALLVLGACSDDDGHTTATTKASTTTAEERAAETIDPNEPGVVDDQDDDQAAGPGVYEFSYEGATGTVEVPTDPGDRALAEFEAYRQEVGAPEVTYFIAEVDNTEGNDGLNMYQVVVVTEEGDQIEGLTVTQMVSEWQERVSVNDTVLYNRGVDLINNNQFFLHPGAKGTAILASPDPVDSVARAYVYPAGGFAEVEAEKV